QAGSDLVLDNLRDAGKDERGERIRAIVRSLASATLEQKGQIVHAQAKLDMGPTFFKSLAGDIVASLRHRGDRTISANNLKQIGLAMPNYHDAFRNLPPAGIDSVRDRDGKPILSWRVAILPFIEQEALYRQFDLTLPWDHPHNKKLIGRMPSIYLLPGAETKE